MTKTADWMAMVEQRQEDLVKEAVQAWKDNLNKGDYETEIYLKPNSEVYSIGYRTGDNARMECIYRGEWLRVLTVKAEETDDWAAEDYIDEFEVVAVEEFENAIQDFLRELKLFDQE